MKHLHIPDEKEFPADGPPIAKLRFALHYAILAPSVHNTQPWRFRMADDSIELHADAQRSLPVVDPSRRELTISCGAALEHLAVAVRHFGHVPEIEHLPAGGGSDLLAVLRLGRAAKPDGSDTRMFRALHQRVTYRRPFLKRPIPADLLPHFVSSGTTDVTWLAFLDRPDDRRAAAGLLVEAVRQLWRDPQYRRELSQWLTPAGSLRTDGIPAHARGVGHLASLLEHLLILRVNLGLRQASLNYGMVHKAPLLAILGTAGDSPSSWLQAGRSLVRILLRGRAAGIHASFFSQPAQVAATREKLAHLAGGRGHPQIVLRMGYGTVRHPSAPRRPLHEVLIETPPA